MLFITSFSTIRARFGNTIVFSKEKSNETFHRCIVGSVRAVVAGAGVRPRRRLLYRRHAADDNIVFSANDFEGGILRRRTTSCSRGINNPGSLLRFPRLMPRGSDAFPFPRQWINLPASVPPSRSSRVP